RVRAFAAETSATTFMVLLAAWAAVVARTAGQDDFGIGAPIAGRTHQAIEPLVGLFVNTLVIRIDASRDPTFRTLVGRVRDAALAAFANQEVPFEAVVEAIAPRRDPGSNPLFQVAFVHNVSRTRPWLAGVTDRRIELPYEGSPFDLTLVVHEDAEGDGLRIA